MWLERPEEWLVYLGENLVLQNGNQAVFALPEEAPRVADLHHREGYPNSEIISRPVEKIGAEYPDYCTLPAF